MFIEWWVDTGLCNLVEEEREREREREISSAMHMTLYLHIYRYVYCTCIYTCIICNYNMCISNTCARPNNMKSKRHDHKNAFGRVTAYAEALAVFTYSNSFAKKLRHYKVFLNAFRNAIAWWEDTCLRMCVRESICICMRISIYIYTYWYSAAVVSDRCAKELRFLRWCDGLCFLRRRESWCEYIYIYICIYKL